MRCGHWRLLPRSLHIASICLLSCVLPWRDCCSLGRLIQFPEICLDPLQCISTGSGSCLGPSLFITTSLVIGGLTASAVHSSRGFHLSMCSSLPTPPFKKVRPPFSSPDPSMPSPMFFDACFFSGRPRISSLSFIQAFLLDFILSLLPLILILWVKAQHHSSRLIPLYLSSSLKFSMPLFTFNQVNLRLTTICANNFVKQYHYAHYKCPSPWI